MLKIDKTDVSTSKRVYFRMFLPSLASFMAARPCFCSFLLFVVSEKSNHMLSATSHIGLEFLRFLLFWGAFSGRYFVLSMFECHVRFERIFDKISEHVKVAKSVDIAVPELAVTSLPGLYAWRPCHAERLALNTSPHHECNPRGSQTGDVATVQWHCHLLLIGQPWGLASCHPENLHRPETVETELARELENQYSKMHLAIDQIQDSIHQSKKHQFFSTSFLQKSE